MSLRELTRRAYRALPEPIQYRVQRVRQGRGAGPSDPTEVFGRVYSNAEWGAGEDGLGSSGPGSAPVHSERYADFVARFIADNGITSVVDIGCGDFQVGAAILDRLDDPPDYLGVDVVPAVIERCRERFGASNVTFECRTISAEDPAPAADLYLIREVLQHLSFADIDRLLGGCEQYRYMLVTNCVTKSAKPRNFDMKTSSWSRRELGSGLWPHLPPIDLDGEVVFRIDHEYPDTEIQTVLVSRESRG